jgi:WD40 repeat protein
MSSADGSVRAATPGQSGLIAAARAGVRETVAESASGGSGRRWLVPLAAAAAVAAAACTPIAWPLLVGGAAVAPAALTALFGQVGGVGGGLLSEAVIRAWDRLHERKHSDAGPGEFQEELANELKEALSSSSADAAGLRAELAGVLQGVDAVKVALTTTIETTVRESGDQVRAVLIEGLQDLGTRFSEFRWMVEEVSDQLTRIAESQAELAAGSRAILEAQQLTLMRLTLLMQRTRGSSLRDGGQEAASEITSASADEERAAMLDADQVPISPDCPYPGLTSFGPQDATRFFGREQLTAVLLTRLAELLTSPGLLMVLGPSGSGKSSLLRAGLLPAIAAGTLPARESGSWPLDLMTPGRRPLLELATHVAALAGIPAGGLHADLQDDPARITAAIRQALLVQDRRQQPTSPVASDVPATAPRLVLIVDQFEEVFTHCTDEQERRGFVQALCAAAGAAGAGGPAPDGDGRARGPADPRDAPALVIIGLRADFYARSAAYPDLVPYLQDRQVLVGPMDEAGLRAAIEGPAASAGLVVDAGLVEVLLADLGVHPGLADPGLADPSAGGSYEAGRLPLLAYALQQTWQHLEGRRLTVAAYRATGGIDQAVARAADAVYEGLDSQAEQVARRLLLRLVNLGEGTADTRRRATVAELTDGTSQAAAHQVLTALIQARLLTTDTDIDGTDTVEISHEALISAWPKLHEWLRQDRAGQRIHRDLIDAAHVWQTQGLDSSLLFSGTRLTVTREWAAGHHDELNPSEDAFLSASQRRKQRATRLRRGAVAALVLLTVVSGVTAGYALQQKHKAQGERDQALASELTTDVGQLQGTDPSLAAQLDLVAGHLQPAVNNTTQILSTGNVPLSNELTGPNGPVSAVAFSPNGRILATASDDGTLRLWNVTNPDRPALTGRALYGSGKGLTSLAFSPDGNTLAAGSGNGTVLLWNVTDPAHPARLGEPLTGLGRYVSSVAFSPDREILAAGSYDDSILLWNVADPAHPVPLGKPLAGGGSSILSLAFSLDGKTLAAGNYGDTTWLWNVTDPARATPIGQPLKSGYPVWAVAFSPAGDLAVSSGETFWIWNVANPAHAESVGLPLTTAGANNTVLSLAFSPDGNVLAAGSGDDKIRLWNLTNSFDVATPIGLPLRGHGGPVYSVAFDPDGYTLASGGGDDIARLWNLPLTTLTGQTSAVGTLAFSPDGSLLATGSNDDTIRLWDVANPAYPAPLGQPITGATGSIESLAFSRDGPTLAAASNDTIRLWSVSDPAHPAALGTPLAVFTGTIRSVAFSPDGRTLAAASGETIWLWDVSNPAHPAPLGPVLTSFTAIIRSVAFSPHGNILAAGSNDDSIRLWDVTHPAHPSPLGPVLYGHTNYVVSVAFSPDGKILASSSSDDTVRLWNVAKPAHASPIGRPLTGPTDIIWGVAFSQDGRTLAAGSADDTIWLWNISHPAHASPVGQPITVASAVDSVAFQPGQGVLATGTGDGTTQLWNLNVDQAIDRICATTGNDLSRQQWTNYVGQLPYTPPCSAQTLPPAPASAGASMLAGTWNGTYYCPQGETGLRLVIQVGPGEELSATFTAYPLPSNPGVPAARFAMTGFYSGRGIVLMPAYWINRPQGYIMVGLTGELAARGPHKITGEVAAPAGCTTFSVQKI